MGRKILLDGKIIFQDTVRISPESPALNFGCGFFETVIYENGRFFFLQDHIERLNFSCIELNIPVPETNLLNEDLLFELTEQNGLKNKSSRIKIMYAPLFTADEWVTAAFCYSYERNTDPVKAIVCTESRENPFYRHKTLSYMQNITVQESNKEFDEVFFTNSRGNITEGTRSNIIGVRNDTLYFTDRREDYLQGVMQKNILKDHKKLGFKDTLPLAEGFTIGSLASFDEIIMTNSLAIARSISSFRHGEHDIKIPAAGHSEKIREFYLSI